MKLRVCRLVLLALPFVLGACGTKLLQPTSTSTGITTNGVTNTSTTTPGLITPTDGAKLGFASQPYTLVIGNTVTTSSSKPTYTFEVASDAGFGNVVYRKTGVPQGAGTTSLTIDALPASTTFFWRARAVTGSDIGPNPKPRSFTVGSQVVLQVPVPTSPSQNGVATGTATLTVANVQRSGPASAITYNFQVSDSSSFANIVFTKTVPEGAGGRTSVTVSAHLTAGHSYYWRVQASDAANFVTTAFSSTYSFKFSSFDMSQARIWDSPYNLATWSQTANITSITFGPGAFYTDFDKRTGPGRWPDVPFGYPGNSLQYTLGVCLNIGGVWNCSAAIQYWFGRSIGATDLIGLNWFYDARWGTLAHHDPKYGELVGIFVGAGNLRDITDYGSKSYVHERSNVALTPWGYNYP